MKKSKFSETEIVSILKQGDAGVAVKDLCRQAGISTATYYQWKSKYGGMEASDLKRVKESPMIDSTRSYIPAFGRDVLLPLYDPMTRLLGVRAAHEHLLEQAALRPGQRVLDIGCGTGTLLLRAARHAPGADLIGINPDPKALGRAREKARRRRLSLRFDEGFAEALPYPDASFDVVLSSLMLHHLSSELKTAVLREAHRVLKVGGRLHLLDFGGPGATRGWLARRLHSNRQLSGNDEYRVIASMREAGLADAVVSSRGRLLIGDIAYYSASHAMR
jgi:ubiquinone/menaquinone biosynthesis C-methylase UbiE